MQLSLIIRAVDQATAPIRRINASARSLASGGLASATRAANAAGRGLDRLGATRIPGRLRAIGGAALRISGRAGLGAIEWSARKATSALGGTVRLAGRLAALGGTALGAGAGMFGRGVLSIASDFEQFQVVLENTEGSAEKAKKAMAWVKEFGKTTPYEVSEVMQAFVSLKAYGIDPTDGSLKSLGNAASGMGKDLMSAIEMLADAQTGEFERLKEFGIRASAQGEKVKLTYMRNGKEMTREVKKSAVEIKRAVTGIFDERFGGMMERQSRTLKGIWSNIKDMFANFQLDVADAGFFDLVKGKVQSLLDKINALAKSGELKVWAQEVSAWLTKAFNVAVDFIERTDWASVARGMGTIVSTLVSIIGWIGRAASAWRNWRLETERERQLSIVDGWLTSSSAKSAALKRVGEINAVLNPRVPGKPNSGVKPGLVPRLPSGRAFPTPPSYQRGRGPVRLGPAVRLPAGRGQGPLKVGGRVQIDLRTQPGTSARVTAMRSDNRDVPIDVRRGAVGLG